VSLPQERSTAEQVFYTWVALRAGLSGRAARAPAAAQARRLRPRILQL